MRSGRLLILSCFVVVFFFFSLDSLEIFFIALLARKGSDPVLLDAAHSSLVTEQGNTFTKRKPENGLELIVFD